MNKTILVSKVSIFSNESFDIKPQTKHNKGFYIQNGVNKLDTKIKCVKLPRKLITYKCAFIVHI